MKLRQREVFHAVMPTGAVTAATQALQAAEAVHASRLPRGGHNRQPQRHAYSQRVARAREFADRLQPQGLEPDLLGPAEFRSFLGSELAKWAQRVNASVAKLD